MGKGTYPATAINKRRSGGVLQSINQLLAGPISVVDSLLIRLHDLFGESFNFSVHTLLYDVRFEILETR